MTKNTIVPGTQETYTFLSDTPQRIDAFLAESHGAGYSRTYFQELIAQGHVTLNGSPVKKPSIVLKHNDSITVFFPLEKTQETTKVLDSAISIAVVHQEKDFLVLAKPPHLSVHAPSVKTPEATLVDWLLVHFQEISDVGAHDRPGIVHRLDKDTSGLLLVARNRYAHELLSDMFKNRLIKKKYLAVVKGHPEKSGTIDLPLARDPIHRIKMRHVHGGRSAITHYKVLEYFKDCSLVALQPITGRTHQLRVHCAAIGHPIIGDSLYGCSSKLIERQALHAYCLEFEFDGKLFSFKQEPDADFQDLLNKLSIPSLSLS